MNKYDKRLLTYVICIIGFAALGAVLMALLGKYFASVTVAELKRTVTVFAVFGAVMGAFLAWCINKINSD